MIVCGKWFLFSVIIHYVSVLAACNRQGWLYSAFEQSTCYIYVSYCT